jgi:hypothetical protein
MTSSVRVEITTTRTQSGWESTMTCPTGNWSANHSVAAFDKEPYYPKPQLPCDDGCDHLLCCGSDAATVSRTLRELSSRELSGEAVERLGRYLFDSLLGDKWADVTALAGRLRCDVVELALTWPYPPASPSCAALAQLPWELMRDQDNRNLAAAGDRVGIAVTRVVADTDRDARPLSVPPRVLFVVGAALTDQSVRAGAEMLALLREVRAAGCRVRYRILENTTPSRLNAAMSAFRPDIVHFISHGSLDDDGRGQLELRSDEEEPQLWRAEQLLANLWVDKQPPTAGNGQAPTAKERQLPSVVVLSACDSAGKVIAGSRIVAPLGAELVHGGIPVVVAMAGTVSDRACRVFTRYFGRALAAGESLVEATAHARRRAFAETSAGADWALPTVFFSAAVDPSAIRRLDDPEAKDLDILADNARWSPIPVFCARENFLQAFWAILDGEWPTSWKENPGNRPSVLVVCARAGQSGVGKTRLLEELAREALLNGHLPLIVGTNDDNPAPRDVRGLAQSLDREIRKLASKVLETDGDLGAELSSFVRRDRTAALDPDSEMSPNDEVAELAERLERDSEKLRSAAMAKYPKLFKEPCQVVLLIDELGETSDPLLTKLFDHDYGLGRNGLGSPRHPVPVVLIALTDDRPGIRTDLLTGSKSETWLVSRELLGFDQGGEDMLAYELVLLNPWRSGGNEQLRQRWIFNREPDAQVNPAEHAQIALQGKPAFFVNDRYEMFVRLGILHKVLTEANDGDTPVSAVR